MEQRFYHRMPYKEDVLVNGAIFRGGNICEDGIYVAAPRPFTLGSTVTVEFSLGGRRFFSKAVVKSSEAPIGVGLNFTGLSGAEREFIGDYIEKNYGKAA